MSKSFEYSILMSVYHKENPKWFEESIESMLSQTILTNDFVIIKDGPLTPELDAVIDKYTKKYPETFNIVALEKNVGLGPALAIGVENCKNEWIARMDSDDYSIPTRIEKQYNEIEKNPNIDMIGSSIAEYTDTIENIQAHRLLPETHDEIVKFSKRRNPFGHPSMLLRKSKVLESGNFRSYYLCEDYDMWIRMIERNAICYNIQEILVYMRISSDFYKRRGGTKYLKSILKFKKEQYKKGYFSTKDYVISAGSHIVVCLMPNFLRNFIYKKLLRK
jgi:Glycosyltransferases, probably involved in cell wall biogenesis